MQNSLQNCFEQWGLPEQIRFDNGKPWANPSYRHLPTSLTLWLVGLGIQPLFGRPRQSTDNAVVERSHGVLANWVEPNQRANLIDLQTTLNAFIDLQRSVYPSCDGQARLTAYPQLRQARQTYQRSKDEALWQLQRVMDYLAKFRFQRLVEKNGRITHLTCEYFLSSRYSAQYVTIYLDAEAHQWVVENRHGDFLKRFDAQQLNYPTIAQMAMVSKKGKT